ncbi:MAG: DUF1566 domain-containing protein [Chlorobiaceae bacterium]|nr:DUF1566 domain-containing protein [Chlorobiaceae bacterium]NTW63978.1 DUF1566 domain-containing protein [Chlorobiaceae bacterium]
MKLNGKAPFTRLWIMLLLTGLSMCTVSALSSAATPKIGDTYNGGVVFYIDATGQHGLVAAPANITDLSSGQEKKFFAWYVAKNAANTFVGGYSDWVLPNKEQLNQLYIHRTAVGGMLDTYYWSSSESDISNAWAQDFSTGEQLAGRKTNTGCVRPIRAF